MSQLSQLHGNQTNEMLSKDRDIKASLFVVLLVTLLGMTSMVLGVVAMPSSAEDSVGGRDEWW